MPMHDSLAILFVVRLFSWFQTALQSSNKIQQAEVMFSFLGFWKFIFHSFRIVENKLCSALLLLLLLPIRSEGWKGGSGPRRSRGCCSSLLYALAGNNSSEILFIVFKVSNWKVFFLSMIITSVRDLLFPAFPPLHCHVHTEGGFRCVCHILINQRFLYGLKHKLSI